MWHWMQILRFFLRASYHLSVSGFTQWFSVLQARTSLFGVDETTVLGRIEFAESKASAGLSRNFIFL
jgi:hypothetical protein